MNECVTGDNGCEHRCENVFGSYLCLCEDGYSLGSDHLSCQGRPIPVCRLRGFFVGGVLSFTVFTKYFNIYELAMKTKYYKTSLSGPTMGPTFNGPYREVPEQDVAQVVEHLAVKVWILLHGGSILHDGCIYHLGYFPFQPVIHNGSIKGCGMYCPVLSV